MKKLISLIIIMAITLGLSGCMSKAYSGTLHSEGTVRDELFLVEADCAILIRNVDMVQYLETEEGVELVFANRVLDPVEGYETFEFPEGLTTEIFCNGLKLGESSLSEEIIKELAYGDLLEKKQLSELPDLGSNDLHLIKVGDAYVTRSDDWQPGEIRVTYSCIEAQDIVIRGREKEGVLSVNSASDISLPKAEAGK